MEHNSLISIIMPVYNAEKYLNSIFRNVREQTYENWELIVVNDCSTDQSAIICDSAASMDSRITVIHLEHNGGAGYARNAGIEQAKGTYITFIDADDEIDACLYEKVMKKSRGSSVDVIVWGVIEEFYNKQEEKVSENRVIFPETFCNSEEEVHKNVLGLEEKTLLGYQWNKIYKADIIQEHHIRFERAILYEDFFFNIEIMKYVTSMFIMEDALYYYKKRMNDSITTKYVEEYYELSYRRIKTLYDICNMWCIDRVRRDNILGQIYLRYILSALMRKNDKEAHVNIKGQLDWIRQVREGELYQKVCMKSHISNRQLKLFQGFMNHRGFAICVLIGKCIFVFKCKVPMFFSLWKKTQ